MGYFQKWSVVSVEDDQLERETVEAALTRKVDDDLGDSSTWITSASTNKKLQQKQKHRDWSWQMNPKPLT